MLSRVYICAWLQHTVYLSFQYLEFNFLFLDVLYFPIFLRTKSPAFGGIYGVLVYFRSFISLLLAITITTSSLLYSRSLIAFDIVSRLTRDLLKLITSYTHSVLSSRLVAAGRKPSIISIGIKPYNLINLILRESMIFGSKGPYLSSISLKLTYIFLRILTTIYTILLGSLFDYI